MNTELLSQMVGELVLNLDVVGLPGLGTFVVEDAPASFSDRGYTINPPYRRLSFKAGRPEDESLVDLYAVLNDVDRDTAKAVLVDYLSQLRDVLIARKTVVLPGLGRLRATRDNKFFFVADEGLDIFPDGIALAPVSLKAHARMPDAPATEPVPAPKSEPASEPAQVPASEPAPVPASEPVPVREPAPIFEPAPASEPEQEPALADMQATAPETVLAESAENQSDHGRSRTRRLRTVLVVMAVLAVLALGAFLILAKLCPDFIDSILYTPEELRILNYYK